MLEQYINERLQEKDLLLMTHIVIGYPDLDASYRIVEKMATAGVDLMELQIPFSEPMADGPVILKANQTSLDRGTTVADCLTFAETVSSRFDIPFLFMSYANIPYRYGFDRFAATMKEKGIRGAIIPDLPPEEGADYLQAMQTAGLASIMLFSPNTSDGRMQQLSQSARGFVYCVARKGVTGKETSFSNELETYLNRCRKSTSLPLAVGFGVKNREDMDFLRGKADIAIIGSETIRLVDRAGVDAVDGFIRGLRT